MRTVGIVTRHCYANYGSLLQAKALSDAIEKQGGCAVVVDYIPQNDRMLRLPSASLVESRMNESLFKRVVYYIVQGPILVLAASVFRSFQKKHLRLSNRVADGFDVLSVQPKLDAVITGSDQVWNRIHGKIDPHYFLYGQSFAATSMHLYSYAASMGSAKPHAEDEAQVLRMVKQLTSLSVREKSCAQYLLDNGISARVDLDPVLLHDSTYWSNFAGQASDSKPYILVYQLHNTDRFDSVLTAIVARLNLPIRRITVDLKQFLKRGQVEYLVDPSVFVRRFRDATLVLTDSFHGTVFSLIFGRRLCVVPPNKFSDRNRDLLNSVGLSDRIMDEKGGLEACLAYYDVDHVETRLNDLRKSSLAYISSVVDA